MIDVVKMTRKAEYDFLTWTSFPSSIKLTNDEERFMTIWGVKNLSVTPGSKVTL